LFVIRFIVAPLSYSFIVLDKQDYDLYWQIGLLIITAFSLLGGSFYFSIKEPVKLLLIYSIIISFWYIVNLLISFSIVKGSKKV
jgi:formate hydrogenlyase subunit 3/multisubunit Na+/H+ antiporter MnhD subunit